MKDIQGRFWEVTTEITNELTQPLSLEYRYSVFNPIRGINHYNNRNFIMGART